MFLIKTVSEILQDPETWKDYKLCYLDDIPETIYDMTPESKEFTKGWGNTEWSKWNSDHIDSEGHYILDPKISYGDYPNPDFIEGTQEKYAYFTSVDLKDQWGDDWDDCPYEHNAGCPYDEDFIEVPFEIQETLRPEEYAVSLSKNPNGTYKKLKRIPYTVLKVPVAFKTTVYEPRDWTRDGCNSHFSVRDINSGAVAWIYMPALGKSSDGVSIQSGCNPLEFIEKLNLINKAYE